MNDKHLQAIRERWFISGEQGPELLREVPPSDQARDVTALLAEVERLKQYVDALKSENKNLQDLSDTTLHTAADAVKRVQAENERLEKVIDDVEEYVVRNFFDMTCGRQTYDYITERRKR